MKRRLVLLIGVLMSVGFLAQETFAASTAYTKAGLLLEPELGIFSGTYDAGALGGTGKVSGNGLGAKVGWVFNPIFLAAEYRQATLSTTPDNAALSASTQNQTEIGALLGVALASAPLRFWVGYYPTLYYDTTTAGVTSTTSGSSYKLGAGVRVFWILSLNAEYEMATYTKAKANGTEVTLDPNPKGNVWFFSVSLPFVL